MHILIAEDEDIIRETFTQMLEEFGFSVASASNGKKAWEQAQLQKPDLLLTDIMMPEMTGFELIAEMKNHPALKQVPIVILSNLEGGEDQEKGRQYGVNDYLIKSNLEVEEVIDIVRRYDQKQAEPVAPVQIEQVQQPVVSPVQVQVLPQQVAPVVQVVPSTSMTPTQAYIAKTDIEPIVQPTNQIPPPFSPLPTQENV